MHHVLIDIRHAHAKAIAEAIPPKTPRGQTADSHLVIQDLVRESLELPAALRRVWDSAWDRIMAHQVDDYIWVIRKALQHNIESRCLSASWDCVTWLPVCSERVSEKGTGPFNPPHGIRTYDAAGNQLTAKDQNGTYTMTYDAVNRVATVKEPFSPVLTFTYDAVGNRTKVDDSFGGIATSTYNAANLLTKREFGGTSQTPLRLDLTYTNRDQLATATRYSDLAGNTKIGESFYTYDSSMRLTNLQHKDGSSTILANYTHTYDVAHRVLTEKLNGGATTTYQYDTTSQLTNDGTNAFTYDANGNRTMSGYATGTGNQLTNDGVYTYTYDNEGNLTKKSKGTNLETWTFGYDHRNQMTWAEKRATDGGTLQMRADYKYDVFGNRIEKAVDADGAGGGGTVTERFAYDGWTVQQDSQGNAAGRIGNEAFTIWVDLSGSNQLQMRRLFTDAVDQVFARINSGGTAAWYLLDRLGSVRDLVNGSGTAINHINYDGFGNVTSESTPSYGDRFKYTAREFDAEIGIQYSRARYYDHQIGRWISQDPLAFDANDLNLYRNTRNSPSNRADPSGLIGVFREGTTLSGSPPAGWTITILYNEYRGKRKALYGVRFAPNNIWSNINSAVSTLRNVVELNPCVPVDLFGYSRGAIAALTVATKLKDFDIKVRFLGLIDPVRNGGFQMVGTSTAITNNVKQYWIGMHRGDLFGGSYIDGTIFSTSNITTYDPGADAGQGQYQGYGSELTSQMSYNYTHNEMGYVEEVQDTLRKAAKYARVPF